MNSYLKDSYISDSFNNLFSFGEEESLKEKYENTLQQVQMLEKENEHIKYQLDELETKYELLKKEYKVLQSAYNTFKLIGISNIL